MFSLQSATNHVLRVQVLITMNALLVPITTSRPLLVDRVESALTIVHKLTNS